MKKNAFIPKLTFMLAVCFLSLNTIAGDLKTGSAAVKITPPPGAPLAGYYYDRAADGVHDDLFAKAIVFEKDGVKAVVISCDLISVPAEIVSAARKLIEKNTGISPGYVMISATHSHTGPVMPKKIDRYNNLRNAAYVKYLSQLPGLIAESAILANSALADAKLSVGKGHEESISFNRRFFMTDGTVGWNPGKLNPRIIEPAGPIDPEVYVLYAETIEEKPLATLVNFALHLDNVGGTEISADMPFTLSSILGRVKGSEMVTLFAQGCAGNINHINVRTKDPQKGHGEAQRIATVLSGEVLKTYTRMKVLDIDNISASQEIVRLKLPDVSPDELPGALEVISRTGKPDAPAFLELVNAHKVVDVLDRNGEPVNSRVAPGSGEILAERALALLNGLKSAGQ